MSTPLRLESIRKRYADTVVLEKIDLQVGASEIVALVGPSGCGKSTLLRLIAGLDVDFGGRICVGEREVRGPDRAVGVVFQELSQPGSAFREESANIPKPPYRGCQAQSRRGPFGSL